MPAIHTEENLHTSTPHRVNLPPLEYLTVPEIRQAAETYARLHREAWQHHGNALPRAERAVHEAEAADAQALADAMLDGGKQPDPRAGTAKAEAELAEVKARQAALWRALDAAYNRLRDTVMTHAATWGATVQADHADAQARYERAAAELDRAHRDLVATGGVLAMLTEDPGGLTVRPYFPASMLGVAAQAVAEAVSDVRTRGPVLTPAEVVAEDEVVV